MKTLLTGMNGTVAPAVARYLEAQGHVTAAWDRTRVPPDDRGAMEAYLDAQAPDLFVHCAMGAPQWAGTLAGLCAARSIRFVFTSTVSVFSEAGTGPYDLTSVPNAEEPYGKYKRECEEAVRSAHPRAWIPRLGWQIGDAPGSNNMLDFIHRQMTEKGFVEASSRWYPSCSHLDETARALAALVEQNQPGLYLVNANKNSSFFDIVTWLARRHPGIVVKETTDFVRDDRMTDPRVPMKNLEESLWGR